MPSNSQDTELEMSIKISNPSSVSSSKRSSLHKTSIQIYQTQDQQFEALEHQMKEIPDTTMGLGHTLPENHTGDNGLLERNLYSSDTKNEQISISPSTSLSQDSVSNSNFPGRKSLISSLKLPPKVLKYSNEPQFFKRGLHDFIQVVTPIFITRLPGVSSKTRPTGHRRGRQPPTDSEHSCQEVDFIADLSFCIFCVVHSILSIHHYPHVIEGAKQLRPQEWIKARGAPVKDNNTPSSSN